MAANFRFTESGANPRQEHPMNSKPFVTEEDVEKFLGWDKKKPKTNNVPTIHFDAPPVTPADIVNNVFNGKGGWKTLDTVLAEADNERRARKFREKYEMTPIPLPRFDPEDCV
jgi:hypothetical protein